ncbi:MAG: ABC transporter permease subunit [Geminicoccales bacterium]
MNASIGRFLVNGNVVIIAVLLVAAGLVSEHFWAAENILNVLRAASLIGIVAVGMNVAIIGGGIDLSVGAVVAVCGAIAASLWVGDAPILLFVLVPLMVALCVGAANGLLVAVVGLQPFVATLILMTVARGAGLVYTGGQPIYADYPAFFLFLSRGWLFGLPMPTMMFALAAIVTWYLMTFRVIGREIYSVGANEKAARLSGVNVFRVKLFTYLYCAFLAGIAGLVLTSRMESGEPGQAGVFWELDAIAAVVIGGTSLRGGKGSIWGAVIGALIIGVVSNMFNLLGVDPAWQQVAKGAIILAAVMIQLLTDTATGTAGAFCWALPNLTARSMGFSSPVLRGAIMVAAGLLAINGALYAYAPSLFQIELAKAPYTRAKNLELTRVYHRAIPLYEDIINDFPESSYAILARIGVANSNKGLDRLEAAQEQYDLLLTEIDGHPDESDYRYDILRNYASLLRDMANTERFKEIHGILVDKYPDSSATREGEKYLDSIQTAENEADQGPPADLPLIIDPAKLVVPDRVSVGETFEIVLEVAPVSTATPDFSLLTNLGFWRGMKLVKVSPNPRSIAEFWGRQSWSFASIDAAQTITATVRADKTGTFEFDLDVDINFDVAEMGISRSIEVSE